MSRFNMASLSTAGVEFVGNLMRYAEVENEVSGQRLLRLGNCEFEFDAAAVVYAGWAPQHIETIQSALKDVFKDTTCSAIRFVIPSSILTRFESIRLRNASETDTKIQIGLETLLLNGGEQGGDIFPGDGLEQASQELSSYAVQHLSSRISQRLSLLSAVFPEQVKGHVPSTNASIRSYKRLMELQVAPSKNVLMMGCYPGTTDYICLSNGSTLRSITIDTPCDTDRVYFAFQVLDRIKEVAFEDYSIAIYGHTLSSDFVSLMAQNFGKRVSILNPGPMVNLDQDRFEKGFPIQAFVPCLGASIA